jgi:hypothetical protein
MQANDEELSMPLPTRWSWGGFPCPAVQGLAEALEGTYDYFDNNKKTRLQWPGRHTADRHAAGLALDIMLHDSGGKASGSRQAWALQFIEIMKNNTGLIGWRQIIFQDKLLKCNDDGDVDELSYTKADHNDHIHIDWVSWSFGVKDFNGTKKISGSDIPQAERGAWMGAVKQDLWNRSSPLATSESVGFHCTNFFGALDASPHEKD